MVMVRTVIGILLIALGLFVFCVSVIGIFRFKYVLNRMHVAAQVDTLGALATLAGLMVLCGFSFQSLKMAAILLFLWMASPVASHLIAKIEVLTHDNLDIETDIAMESEADADGNS